MSKLNVKSKKLIGSLAVLTILVGGTTVMVTKQIPKVESNISIDSSISVGLHLQQGKIDTLIGAEKEGYSGDGSLLKNAQINKPRGMYIDKSDNIYIADSGNHRIRMIPNETGNHFGVNMTKGNIYTIAGNGITKEDGSGDYSGDDGKAIDAQLNYPERVTLDSKGNLYIADVSNNCVRKIDINGTITTVAGIGGNFAKNDIEEGKKGAETTLGRIKSIAIDKFDNLYIGEQVTSMDNYIRKVDLNSGDTYILTSKQNDNYISYGDNRLLKDIKMNSDITNIIFDNYNNMYVATGSVVIMIPSKDGVNFNIPMKSGKAYYIAGRYENSNYQGDGITSTGINLKQAHDISLDSIGNLYISNKSLNDPNEFNTIHFIDRKSGIISTISGNGDKEVVESGDVARDIKLDQVKGVSIDSKDNIYICDYRNSKIYHIEPKKIAKNPPKLEQDFKENLVHKSKKITFKDDKDWRKSVTKVYVNGKDIKREYKLSEGKLEINKKLFNESGIYVINVKAKGYEDSIIVKKINSAAKELSTDTKNNKVGDKVEITFEDDPDWRNGVLRYSLTYGVYINDRLISTYDFSEGKLIIDPTMFRKPGTYTIKVVSLGYEDSIVKQKIVEREKSTDSEVTLKEIQLLAGNGERGYFGEGVSPTEAKFIPRDVYIDKSNNIFITDTSNQRIRMIPNENGTYYGISMLRDKIYTVAGDGTVDERLVKDQTERRTDEYKYSYTGSYGGDGGQATKAKLNNPMNVVIDKRGNLYISDYGNNCIRRVDNKGIITTVAGGKGKIPLKHDGKGIQGDGEQATATPLVNILDMYIDDEADILYFSQLIGIRKLNLQTGIIDTLTGSQGDGSYHIGRKEAIGDKGPVKDAEFNLIKSILFDKNKNMYMLDSNQIRMVPNESGTYFGTEMTRGNIYTVSGHYYISDYFGDGYSASEGRVKRPNDIVTDSRGNIYIADSGNNCIRFISKNRGTIHTIVGDKDDRFGSITGLDIDKDDNLYFVDETNMKIYKSKIYHKEQKK